jgi:hypothetical protein
MMQMPIEHESKKCTSMVVDHDGMSHIEMGLGGEFGRASGFDASPRNASPNHVENVH